MAQALRPRPRGAWRKDNMRSDTKSQSAFPRCFLPGGFIRPRCLALALARDLGFVSHGQQFIRMEPSHDQNLAYACLICHMSIPCPSSCTTPSAASRTGPTGFTWDPQQQHSPSYKKPSYMTFTFTFVFVNMSCIVPACAVPRQKGAEAFLSGVFACNVFLADSIVNPSSVCEPNWTGATEDASLKNMNWQVLLMCFSYFPHEHGRVLYGHRSHSLHIHRL